MNNNHNDIYTINVETGDFSLNIDRSEKDIVHRCWMFTGTNVETVAQRPIEIEIPSNDEVIALYIKPIKEIPIDAQIKFGIVNYETTLFSPYILTKPNDKIPELSINHIINNTNMYIPLYPKHTTFNDNKSFFIGYQITTSTNNKINQGRYFIKCFIKKNNMM